MSDAATVHLSIGGRSEEPSSNRYFFRKNPITGDVATRAAAAGVIDARRAAEAADGAFVAWSGVGPNPRRAFLNKAADALESRASSFVEAMMLETGSTEMWARFNLMLEAADLAGRADLLVQFMQFQRLAPGGAEEPETLQ